MPSFHISQDTATAVAEMRAKVAVQELHQWQQLVALARIQKAKAEEKIVRAEAKIWW